MIHFLRRIARPTPPWPMPCDWDFETFCTVDGCHAPANHQLTVGMTDDGYELVELVCCHNAVTA
jgi:hypothetical protein